MPDIFGAQIAQAINSALGPLVFDLTLIKRTPGTRTTVTGGTQPTETSYAARGFVDDYNTRRVDGQIVQQGDRLCVILGASTTAVPAPNDKITIEGETRRIVSVVRDPAGATYECQIR